MPDNLREVPDGQLDDASPADLRQELVRVREQLRWHRDLVDNDRCWHADRELYARTLPENEDPGRMTSPKAELRRNCDAYIDGQQCEQRGCAGTHLKLAAPEERVVHCGNCNESVEFPSGEDLVRCIRCGNMVHPSGQIMRIG